MALLMQPQNEKFFTLFSKAGSNVVESAAILIGFVAAPRRAVPSTGPLSLNIGFLPQ